MNQSVTGRVRKASSDRSREQFLKGIRDGVPIALGYFAVSFTFGMMGVRNGLTIWQVTLISLTNLTSAGQFAGLGIIAAGGSYAELAISQLIINLRYCLMSFSVAQKLDPGTLAIHRPLVAFGITDEIFGISASAPGKLNPFYNYGAMSIAIPGWTLGTLFGAISGGLLPAFVMSALSVAIYGMFLAIIVPASKKDRPVLFAVVSAMLISALFTYAPVLSRISSGFRIIIITLLVAGVAAKVSPVREEETV